MGRRSAERQRGGASHAVLVSHPSRPEARACELSFEHRGVVLRAAGTQGTIEVLRVPWWALEGLSADATAPDPEGRVVQVVRLVTDAGELALLLPAPAVTLLLVSLRPWTRRWRGARRPLDRHAERLVAHAGPVVRRVCGALGALGARDAFGGLAALAARLRLGTARRPRAVLGALGATVLSLALFGAVALSAGPPGVDTLSASVAPLGPSFDASGMAQILQAAEFQAGAAAHLVRATAPPPPAPAAVADATPLSSHEVLGFAPYWSLGQEATVDVSAYTTLAYFAVGVNANGTLDESGTGWDGYQSQDFADLVARAHTAGDRVVLTVNCFSQPALNALTSSPAAAATLASAVVHAVAAKNLDGVNLDLEGQGPADRAGLTALVATVSSAMHAANPHYQVTVDTYASSAGDPGGFYDVPALAKVVDGLFVMAYGTNLGSSPSAASPITSAEYADTTAAAQYAAAVAPSKVIFGVPYFGYVWPTTNGTVAAAAMGTGRPITYAEVMASGNPIYWDPVTDSAWTSYEVGHQWFEAHVDDPASVYLVAQLAQREGFAGVGAWAIGMDGNSPQMAAALDGNAPPERAGPAGPASTSTSAGAGAAGAHPVRPPRPAANLPNVPAMATVPGPTPSTTPVPVPGSAAGENSGTGTGAVAGAGGGAVGTRPPTYRYSGAWDGQAVTLTRAPTAAPSGTGTLLGTLSGFSTDDPALSCLARTPAGIAVWHYPGAGTDLVIARQPTNCVDAELTFAAGTGTAGAAGASGTGGTGAAAGGTGAAAGGTGAGAGAGGLSAGSAQPPTTPDGAGTVPPSTSGSG